MTSRLVAGALVTALLGAGTAAGGDVSVNVGIGVPAPPPIVVAAPPPLVVVPGVRVVSYAPALQVDVFVFQGRWYYPHGGHWYVGPGYRGPWKPIAFTALPPAVVAVPPKYYKVPPGHWKHGGPGGSPGHARKNGKSPG
jgi:hypothetical protein